MRCQFHCHVYALGKLPYLFSERNCCDTGPSNGMQFDPGARQVALSVCSRASDCKYTANLDWNKASYKSDNWGSKLIRLPRENKLWITSYPSLSCPLQYLHFSGTAPTHPVISNSLRIIVQLSRRRQFRYSALKLELTRMLHNINT